MVGEERVDNLYEWDDEFTCMLFGLLHCTVEEHDVLTHPTHRKA